MGALALPSYGSTFVAQSWQANRVAQARHYTGWVYVAVRALASQVAKIDPNLSVVRPAVPDRTSKGGYRYKHFTDRRLRAKALTAVKPHEDLEPLDEDHPLARLLARPNPDDTAADVRYETTLFLELTGSAYWWLPPSKVTGADGRPLPAEIWVLPSHWVYPIASGDERVVNEYEVRPVYGGAHVFRFPADEVLHFRYKSPLSKIDGWSPLTAGARWVDQSESVDAARWSSFKNGAVPGVAIELPENGYTDPSPEDIERIEQKFINKFSGENKYGRPIVLSPGLKVVPLTVTPREMDYNASAEQIRDFVLALFHVSKTAAGITEEVNFASALVAKANMFEYAVNPIVSLVDQVLTAKLAPRYDRKIRVWHADMAPVDPAQALAENTAYLDRGVKTINEVREDLGLEPYPHGGDDPVLPQGVAPVPYKSGEDIDWSAVIESAQAAAGQKPDADAAQAPGQGGAPGGPGGLAGPPGKPDGDGSPEGPEPKPAGIPSRLGKVLANGHAKNGRRVG